MRKLSRAAHGRLTCGGDCSNMEALRSVYERLELRVWSLLPTRVRRRLTTYGIAELMAQLPDEPKASRVTVAELLEIGSPPSERRPRRQPPGAGGGSRFERRTGRAPEGSGQGEIRRELVAVERR
jgi:hypothetical protein